MPQGSLPSPLKKKRLALIVFATVISLAAIGLPSLTSDISPSLNLAKLPGSSGALVRNCTANSPASWQSCVAAVNQGRAQRIYINGMISCSDGGSDRCDAKIALGSKTAPVAIFAAVPQESGFRRAGCGLDSDSILKIQDSSDVTIRDLRFEETGSARCPNAKPLLSALNSIRVTISGVIISGARGDAIALHNVKQGVVINSDIQNSGRTGISISQDPGLDLPQFDILGNSITGNSSSTSPSPGSGMVLSASGSASTKARIEGNVITAHGDGIVLSDPSRNLSFHKNSISLNVGGTWGGNGISILSEAGTTPNVVEEVAFTENQIFNNGGFAIERISKSPPPCANLTLVSNTLRENLCRSERCLEQVRLLCSRDSAEPSSPSGSGSGSPSPTILSPRGETTSPPSTIPLTVNAPPPPPLNGNNTSSPTSPLQNTPPTTTLLQSSPPPAADITVRNGASLNQDDKIAPGSLISIFYRGEQFKPCSADLTKGKLPTELCGISVSLSSSPDKVFPLLYVSQNQINAQVPTSVSPTNPYPREGWQPYSLKIRHGQKEFVSEPFTVHAAGPAIFRNGDRAILAETFRWIRYFAPADHGTIGYQYFLSATGLGIDSLRTQSNTPGSRQQRIEAEIEIRIGDQTIKPTSAFKGPNLFGVDHIVFTVPKSLPPGEYPLTLCATPGATNNPLPLGLKHCSSETVRFTAVLPNHPLMIERIEPYNPFTKATEGTLVPGGLARAVVSGIDPHFVERSIIGYYPEWRFETLPSGWKIDINDAPTVFKSATEIVFQVPFDGLPPNDFVLSDGWDWGNSLIDLPMKPADLSGAQWLIDNTPVTPGQEIFPKQTVTIRGTGFGQSTPPLRTGAAGSGEEVFDDLELSVLYTHRGKESKEPGLYPFYKEMNLKGIKTSQLGIDQITFSMPVEFYEVNATGAGYGMDYRFEVCRSKTNSCSVSPPIFIPPGIAWSAEDDTGRSIPNTSFANCRIPSPTDPSLCIWIFGKENGVAPENLRVSPRLKTGAECNGDSECLRYTADNFEVVPEWRGFLSVTYPHPSYHITFRLKKKTPPVQTVTARAMVTLRNKTPLAGMKVIVDSLQSGSNSSRTLTSDANGIVSFEATVGSPFTLRAEPQLYRDEQVFPVETRISGTVSNEMTTLTMTYRPRICVKITALSSSQRALLNWSPRLPGLPVVSGRPSLNAPRTDSQGNYCTPSLSPDSSWSVTPSLPGFSFAPASQSVTADGNSAVLNMNFTGVRQTGRASTANSKVKKESKTTKKKTQKKTQPKSNSKTKK